MFTQKQIKELLKNNNVRRCSPKSITYKKDFKLRAVKQYQDDGYSSRMIFEEAGFDIAAIGRKRAKDSLSRWRRTYNSKGEKALMKESRGIPKAKETVKFKNKDQKIEHLETKIKYLNAENDFLAELRGLKRE